MMLHRSRADGSCSLIIRWQHFCVWNDIMGRRPESVTLNQKSVFTSRTFLPNFISIWFETTEPYAVLKRSSQQRQDQSTNFICQVWQHNKYNEQWWQDNKAFKCTNSCPHKQPEDEKRYEISFWSNKYEWTSDQELTARALTYTVDRYNLTVMWHWPMSKPKVFSVRSTTR